MGISIQSNWEKLKAQKIRNQAKEIKAKLTIYNRKFMIKMDFLYVPYYGILQSQNDPNLRFFQYLFTRNPYNISINSSIWSIITGSHNNLTVTHCNFFKNLA